MNIPEKNIDLSTSPISRRRRQFLESLLWSVALVALWACNKKSDALKEYNLSNWYSNAKTNFEILTFSIMTNRSIPWTPTEEWKTIILHLPEENISYRLSQSVNTLRLSSVSETPGIIWEYTIESDILKSPENIWVQKSDEHLWKIAAFIKKKYPSL